MTHVTQREKKIKRERNWGIITTPLKQNYYGMHVMVDIYYESFKQLIMWMVEIERVLNLLYPDAIVGWIMGSYIICIIKK